VESLPGGTTGSLERIARQPKPKRKRMRKRGFRVARKNREQFQRTANRLVGACPRGRPLKIRAGAVCGSEAKIRAGAGLFLTLACLKKLTLRSNFKTMLQRKQSLWLLISACLMGLTFYMPFSVQMLSTVGTAQIMYTPLYNYTFFGLMALTLLSMLMPVVTLFLFKNRGLQMRLIIIGLGLQLGTLVTMLMKSFEKESNHKFILGFLGSQLFIGLVFPVLAAVALYLAYNGVRADEKLVKSADRMR